jgi:hypothetical protein
VDRKQGRNAYRDELKAEFFAMLPKPLFRRLTVRGNADWTPRKVVTLSVIMFWVSGNTLEEQFSAARHIVKFMWSDWTLPSTYAGFVEAQQRWWPLIAPLLIARLRPDESVGESWRVLGWLVLAVDGSRFECPRTDDNKLGLGCAGREKSPPQIFHTLLQHVGTGLPWDFRCGPGTDSERRHLDDMVADLPEQTLLTADCGFVSYELCDWLIEARKPFVMRVGGNRTLLEELIESDEDPNVVYLWPERVQKQGKPALKLRRICFRSTGDLPVVLITNVLDADRLSDEDAQTIYQARWGIEIYFRSLKQTMDFGTMRSRTPATALNEHIWKLISFWMLQRIVVVHQIAKGQNPRRFSAATARREIREVLQLMQQSRRGKSLKQRCLKMTVDDYQREGPKATGEFPRKKNDKPPQPPKTKVATAAEVRRAARLGIKFLLLS